MTDDEYTAEILSLRAQLATSKAEVAIMEKKFHDRGTQNQVLLLKLGGLERKVQKLATLIGLPVDSPWESIWARIEELRKETGNMT